MVHSWVNHLSFPAFTTKKDYKQLNVFPPCSNFMEDNIPTHAYCSERNYNFVIFFSLKAWPLRSISNGKEKKNQFRMHDHNFFFLRNKFISLAKICQIHVCTLSIIRGLQLDRAA